MTEIRTATAGDAATLAGLATQLGYPADGDAIARRLAAIAGADAGIALVAVAADDRVCGLARALPQRFVVEEPFVELAALIVADGARGQGVGAALLARVEAWARERGFIEVRIRSNVIRERAHRFYRRQGYVEDKRQVVFSKPTG